MANDEWQMMNSEGGDERERIDLSVGRPSSDLLLAVLDAQLPAVAVEIVEPEAHVR
jgi:hypothetical protein